MAVNVERTTVHPGSVLAHVARSTGSEMTARIVLETVAAFLRPPMVPGIGDVRPSATHGDFAHSIFCVLATEHNEQSAGFFKAVQGAASGRHFAALCVSYCLFRLCGARKAICGRFRP